jgi:hypothetical protein
MKTKSFQEYLKKRLSKQEILHIERQAAREVKILRYLQTYIASLIDDYIERHNITASDLVRGLDWSPSKVAQVKKGQANLTLESLAHLFAFLDTEPQELFKSKK